MGSFSIWHWLIALAVIVLVFGGGGKIPKLMRDVGQGITAFKRGMKEDKDKVEADATSPGVSPSVTHQDKAAG